MATKTKEQIQAEMAANSAAWHTADDATKKQLEAANKELGAQLGASFDSGSGKWSDSSGNALYEVEKPSSSKTYSPTFSGSATGVGTYNGDQDAIKAQMNANSIAWHTADEATRKQLEAANKALAAQLGGSVAFDPGTGTWSGDAKQPLINNQYNSQYSSQIDSLLDAIINRKPFEYDYTTDPNYIAYEQQYKRLGDRAREDTLGNVAALNGGYTSSWAVNAASQAQNDYNQQLSGIIPELYDAAYQRYLNEDSMKRSDLGLFMNVDDMNYNRFRDNVGDEKWLAEFNNANDQWNKQFDYNANRDAISDSQWQQTFDWNKYMDQWNMDNAAATQKFDQMMSKWQLTGVADEEVAAALGVPVGATTESYYFNKAQLELSKQKAASSGGGGGSNIDSGSGSFKNNPNYDKIKELIFTEARAEYNRTGNYRNAAQKILDLSDAYGITELNDYFDMCKEFGIQTVIANRVWSDSMNDYLKNEQNGGDNTDALLTEWLNKANAHVGYADAYDWFKDNKLRIPSSIYDEIYKRING